MFLQMAGTTCRVDGTEDAKPIDAHRDGLVVLPEGQTQMMMVYFGVQGAEWENLHYKFVEMNKEVNVRCLGGSSRTNMLLKMRDAKETDDAYCDRTVRVGARTASGRVGRCFNGCREQQLIGEKSFCDVVRLRVKFA